MRLAFALLLLVLAPPVWAGPLQPVAAGPRVVSMNPCVDAILVEVADAGQIVSISHYSKDARAASIPADVAARFVANYGTAEEAVGLAPDIVMAGAHVAPSTVAAMRRLGIRLLQFGVANTVAQSKAQVQAIADAVGHPERGVRLNARIDAAVMRARSDSKAVPALIWLGGGLVPGRGTLADAMLGAAGFRNVSAEYGLEQWDVLPLERLVAAPPRVLLTTRAAGGRDRMLAHPVLRPLAGTIAVREFSQNLLFCGGPTIVTALDRLAAVRADLP